MDAATSPEVTVDRLNIPWHTYLMEATADTMNSVHVLRHSFRPSEHLGKALERYMKKEATHPPFLLYATRLIALSTEQRSIYEINADFDVANRAFVNRHSEQVRFSQEEDKRRVIHARLLANGALRVGMLPSNYEAFQSLLAGFDELPNDMRSSHSNPVRHFIHADIPATSLDGLKIETATDLMEEELSVHERARMYYAVPSAIDRRIVRMPTMLPGPKQHE